MDTACVSTFFDFSVLWYFLNRMILLSLYLGKIITFLDTFVGFESKLSPNDINYFVFYTPVSLMMDLISPKLI